MLTNTQNHPVTPPFMWRMKGGQTILVQRMGIDHLFYAFLMIWNHAAPSEYRIWFNHRYQFSPETHPHDYLLRAFIAFYSELSPRRAGLTRKKLRVFNDIERHIKSMRIPDLPELPTVPDFPSCAQKLEDRRSRRFDIL